VTRSITMESDSVDEDSMDEMGDAYSMDEMEDEPMDDEPKTNATLREERLCLEVLLPKQERFMFAIRDDEYDKVEEFLISGEIDVNDKTGLHGHTPLHRAVQYGSVNIIQLLLIYGGDVCATNTSSQSPLHMLMTWRCRKRNRIYWIYKMTNRDIEVIVRLLLQHGTDVNASGYQGETPLQCAVTDCTWVVVKMLLDHGAKISKTDDKGYNALHSLSDREGAASVRNKICKTMLDHVSHDWRQTLQITSEFAYVNFDLNHDPDVSDSDSDGDGNHLWDAEDLAEILEHPGLGEMLHAAHMRAFVKELEVNDARRAKEQAEKSEVARQRKTAVAMGLDSRLGAKSGILTLGKDITEMIAKNM
jgi:hypothetical protein